jgi:1-acyl-sn-glycerol-3-phosphate acyltransferase
MGNSPKSLRDQAAGSAQEENGSMKYLLGKLVLSLAGWKVNGHPPKVPKYLLIAAPHTSNWDFVFGLAAIFFLRLNLNWFGKDSIFVGPFGWIFRKWGGIALDRKNRSNTVSLVVKEFRSRSTLAIGLAPEGTRSHTTHWKSGFYHMALEAGVPLALAFFDYEKKEVGVGLVLDLTGDINADMEKIRTFYADKRGKYSELAGPVRLQEETSKVS